MADAAALPPDASSSSLEKNLQRLAIDETVKRERLPSAFTFSRDDIVVDVNEITLGPCIGKGNFASVFVGQYFGDYVAVKKQKMKTDMASYLVTELALLANLKHECPSTFRGTPDCNESAALHSYGRDAHYRPVLCDPMTGLMQYVGCGFLGDDHICIVTEYLSGGDLRHLLLGDESKGTGGQPLPLSWAFRVRIMRDVLAALTYIRGQDVVHRDIKPENVLLTSTYKAKLCDFGFARKDETSANRRMTLCGTDEYMAPEIMFDEEYHAAADMFAFGLVLAEIITRRAPGRDGFLMRPPQNSFAVDLDELRSACAASPPAAAAGCPESLVELCAQLCSYDADGRPDAEAAADWVLAVAEETPGLLESTDGELPTPESPERYFMNAAAADAEGGGGGASSTSIRENGTKVLASEDAGPSGLPGGQREDASVPEPFAARSDTAAIRGSTDELPSPRKTSWRYCSGPARVRSRIGAFRIWRKCHLVLDSRKLALLQLKDSSVTASRGVFSRAPPSTPAASKLDQQSLSVHTGARSSQPSDHIPAIDHAHAVKVIHLKGCTAVMGYCNPKRGIFRFRLVKSNPNPGCPMRTVLEVVVRTKEEAAAWLNDIQDTVVDVESCTICSDVFLRDRGIAVEGGGFVCSAVCQRFQRALHSSGFQVKDGAVAAAASGGAGHHGNTTANTKGAALSVGKASGQTGADLAAPPSAPKSSAVRPHAAALPPPLPASAKPSGAAPSPVKDWLASLHLEELWPLFEAKRYTNMKILVVGKLTDEDLDFIGVTLPIQRRILKESLA